MKTITSFIRFNVITLIVAMVLSWSTLTWATIISFEFEGPVLSTPENLGTFVTGKVTYDTMAPRIDGGGIFDKGDRFLYVGAITSFEFMTETVSGAYSGGNIQLWNDYESCLHVTSTGCLNYLEELDRLVFSVDDFADVGFSNVSIYLIGEDQSFLSSGDLPEKVPTEGYFRNYFTWTYIHGDEDLTIRGDIQIPSQTVPEPNTLLLILVGLIILLYFKLGASKYRI